MYNIPPLGKVLPSGQTGQEPVLSLSGRIRELEALVKKLEAELSHYRELNVTDREVTRLRNLDHFYARVVNAPVNQEARQVLDEIVSQYIHILGEPHDS